MNLWLVPVDEPSFQQTLAKPVDLSDWDGGPTLNVYAVEGYDDSIDVVPETVNRLLGYEESFWPKGLWRVSDDRPTDQVVQKFDI